MKFTKLIKTGLSALCALSLSISGGALLPGGSVHAETLSTSVIAEVDGQYTVTIPKEIILTLQEDGSHAGTYTVDVEGQIPKNSYVTVVPESEITLSSEGREDVQCDVTQVVQKFRSTSYDGDVSGLTDTVIIDNSTIDTNGTVKTKDGQYLASGHWAGVLNFEINLVSDSTVSGGDAEETVE